MSSPGKTGVIVTEGEPLSCGPCGVEMHKIPDGSAWVVTHGDYPDNLTQASWAVGCKQCGRVLVGLGPADRVVAIPEEEL